MSSGVATTIHFMYPVLTTLIMMIFFREKKSPWRIAAIALAVSGVFSFRMEIRQGLLLYWVFYRSALCFGLRALSGHRQSTEIP